MTRPALLPQPYSWLEVFAATTPRATFFSDLSQSLTFADAHLLVQKVHQRLREVRVRQGDIVALELPTGLQVVFVSALFREGAASVHHSEPQAGEQLVVADWLFTTERTASAVAKNVVAVDAAFLRQVDSAVVTEADCPGFASEDSLVRIVYSSGTTGTPKAIGFTLSMTHHRALSAAKLFQKGSPFLSILPLSSGSGFHTLYACMSKGEPYLSPGTGDHNADMVARLSVGAIKASPAQLADLVDAADARGTTLPSLKNIYSAGSALAPRLVRELERISPARVHTLYGSTEAGRCAQRQLTDSDTSNNGPIATGTQVRIVDEAGQPVSEGTTGFIHYRRDHQATKYLGNPEASAAFFTDGWFVTGDLGYLTEKQELIVLGRAGDVVNAGGVKINLNQLDMMALDIGGITDAAAFVVPDRYDTLESALAVVTDGELAGQDLIAAVKNELGSSAPNIIFSIPRIPRNSAGKIMRSELADLYRSAIDGSPTA